MARNFNGSSQYGVAGTAAVTSGAVTFAAWVYPTSLSSPATVLGIDNSSSGTAYIQLAVGYPASTNVYAATYNGTTLVVSSVSTINTNTWSFVALTLTSGGSLTAYLNGTAGTPQSGAAIPATVNETTVGNLWGGSSRAHLFPGNLAECVIWNVDLVANEIAALAKGSPWWGIRPSSMVFYAPLLGLSGSSTEPDYSGNARNLTLTGSPTAANHAPVMSSFAPPWQTAPFIPASSAYVFPTRVVSQRYEPALYE